MQYNNLTDKQICDLLDNLANALPNHPCEHSVWATDDEFLCRKEETANAIADIIDIIYGESVCVTGYYDPGEDERNGESDERSGYYYVAVC